VKPHVLRVRSGFCALSVSKLAAPITPGGIGSKTIIPGISADESYSENANNALSFLPKIRKECRRQNPLAVR
ncbi:hypothetical protein D3180_14480, partial [Salmonella enterica subsp. enterica serovar Cerro]|nr:hypothetical protein [Salmonella enterica subsp. enterica serovar Cerro]